MMHMDLSERDAAIRRVMRTVARYGARNSLPVTNDDGTSPMVIALPKDSMSDVHDRVVRAGGHANVFVAYEEDIALVVLRCEHTEIEDDHPGDLHPDIEIDMFIAAARSSEPGESFTMKVSSEVSQLDYVF